VRVKQRRINNNHRSLARWQRAHVTLDINLLGDAGTTYAVRHADGASHQTWIDRRARSGAVHSQLAGGRIYRSSSTGARRSAARTAAGCCAPCKLGSRTTPNLCRRQRQYARADAAHSALAATCWICTRIRESGSCARCGGFAGVICAGDLYCEFAPLEDVRLRRSERDLQDQARRLHCRPAPGLRLRQQNLRQRVQRTRSRRLGAARRSLLTTNG
jgi:hypothetical protein